MKKIIAIAFAMFAITLVATATPIQSGVLLEQHQAPNETQATLIRNDNPCPPCPPFQYSQGPRISEPTHRIMPSQRKVTNDIGCSDKSARVVRNEGDVIVNVNCPTFSGQSHCDEISSCHHFYYSDFGFFQGFGVLLLLLIFGGVVFLITSTSRNNNSNPSTGGGGTTNYHGPVTNYHGQVHNHYGKNNTSPSKEKNEMH